MAKGLGNNYRLWIESATPGTYNQIKGNTTLSIARQAALIDTSSKDDGNYGTQAPGQRSLTISAEVIPTLPDANGYARLEAAANANPQVATNFQIRKGGDAGADADAVFEGKMWIGDFNTSMDRNDVVKCSFQLTLESAPTTDELAI